VRAHTPSGEAKETGSGRALTEGLGTPLTEEEERVLKLLVAGRTGQEMAAELGIAEETVRTHIQIILAKLQVHSRLDPPPLPPAASAALAVPLQRAEDVPTHVGRYLRWEGSSS
jgi:DNA-binding CsgD family transcriptional regulator